MGTKILPVEGQVYTNRNGGRYLCEAVTEDGAGQKAPNAGSQLRQGKDTPKRRRAL